MITAQEFFKNVVVFFGSTQQNIEHITLSNPKTYFCFYSHGSHKADKKDLTEKDYQNVINQHLSNIGGFYVYLTLLNENKANIVFKFFEKNSYSAPKSLLKLGFPAIEPNSIKLSNGLSIEVTNVDRIIMPLNEEDEKALLEHDKYLKNYSPDLHKLMLYTLKYPPLESKLEGIDQQNQQIIEHIKQQRLQNQQIVEGMKPLQNQQLIKDIKQQNQQLTEGMELQNQQFIEIKQQNQQIIEYIKLQNQEITPTVPTISQEENKKTSFLSEKSTGILNFSVLIIILCLLIFFNFSAIEEIISETEIDNTQAETSTDSGQVETKTNKPLTEPPTAKEPLPKGITLSFALAGIDESEGAKPEVKKLTSAKLTAKLTTESSSEEKSEIESAIALSKNTSKFPTVLAEQVTLSDLKIEVPKNGGLPNQAQFQFPKTEANIVFENDAEVSLLAISIRSNLKDQVFIYKAEESNQLAADTGISLDTQHPFYEGTTGKLYLIVRKRQEYTIVVKPDDEKYETFQQQFKFEHDETLIVCFKAEGEPETKRKPGYHFSGTATQGCGS